MVGRVEFISTMSSWTKVPDQNHWAFLGLRSSTPLKIGDVMRDLDTGGPAWTPDFAAVMPSGYQPGDTAMLEMKYSLDLRQAVEPEITVWTRTSQPFASQLELGPLRALVEGIPGFEDAVNQNLQNLRRRFGDQRINLIIEGTDRSMVKQIYSGLGNALFERKSWPLTDFIDDPDVRISFEYELGDGPFPAVYVDSVSVAEKPADQLSLTTPRVLDFPNDYTQLVTEGGMLWSVLMALPVWAQLCVPYPWAATQRFGWAHSI